MSFPGIAEWLRICTLDVVMSDFSAGNQSPQPLQSCIYQQEKNAQN